MSYHISTKDMQFFGSSCSRERTIRTNTGRRVLSAPHLLRRLLRLRCVHRSHRLQCRPQCHHRSRGTPLVRALMCRCVRCLHLSIIQRLCDDCPNLRSICIGLTVSPDAFLCNWGHTRNPQLKDWMNSQSRLQVNFTQLLCVRQSGVKLRQNIRV